LLEEALEAERTDWLGVGRYVRDEAGRRDYRNGYYRRDLGTRLGLVRGLRVPRTRSGCPSLLLSRYQRRQASVNELVREAFLRGFEGRHLRLIVTDGSTGLAAALALVYPQVPQQRCWAHKLRNIADKVPKKEGSCVREAAAIYQAANRREALAAYRAWAQKWRPTRPRAVASLERDLDELLNFFAVPQAHWRKVRTTNVIERCFREVRRRTRPISSFTNSASCDRIIFGVISHLNRAWETKPLKQFTQNASRYLNEHPCPPPVLAWPFPGKNLDSGASLLFH